MKNLTSALAVLLVAFSACGGNVVVDGAATSTVGTGGTGGTGDTGGSVSSSGTSVASCFNLPARSSLTLCQSSATPTMCSFIYNCNEAGGAWEAICSGSACQCLNSGNVLCECAFNNTANACSVGTDCCFQ